jgi:hypothetical protein
VVQFDHHRSHRALHQAAPLRSLLPPAAPSQLHLRRRDLLDWLIRECTQLPDVDDQFGTHTCRRPGQRTVCVGSVARQVRCATRHRRWSPMGCHNSVVCADQQVLLMSSLRTICYRRTITKPCVAGNHVRAPTPYARVLAGPGFLTLRSRDPFRDQR